MFHKAIRTKAASSTIAIHSIPTRCFPIVCICPTVQVNLASHAHLARLSYPQRLIGASLACLRSNRCITQVASLPSVLPTIANAHASRSLVKRNPLIVTSLQVCPLIIRSCICCIRQRAGRTLQVYRPSSLIIVSIGIPTIKLRERGRSQGASDR